MRHQVLSEGQCPVESRRLIASRGPLSVLQTDLSHAWQRRSLKDRLLSRPQVAHRIRQDQPPDVLGQPNIGHLRGLKLQLDHLKRVLRASPDSSLDRLQLPASSHARAILVQYLAFARANSPGSSRRFPWTRLAWPRLGSPHHRRHCSPGHEKAGRLHEVGFRADDAVHQAQFSVRADVDLHSEVSLVALLDLLRLRDALTRLVLGGTGCGNRRRIHRGSGFEHQPLRCRTTIDRPENLSGQRVLLQQVAKAVTGRVAQALPQMKTVYEQHVPNRKGRPPTQCLMRAARILCDQHHQLHPGHHPVHLCKENLIVRLLWLGVKTERGLVHVKHPASLSTQRPLGGDTWHYRSSLAIPKPVHAIICTIVHFSPRQTI